MNTSVGQQLRRRRQARSLSLEEVAKATHLHEHYLRAIEEDNLEIFPSRAQAKGFLRAYAEYLGEDPAPMAAALGIDTQHLAQESAEEAPPSSSDAVEAPSQKETTPTLRPRMPTFARQKEPEKHSQEMEDIFREIGDDLRRQRELLGLSIEDIETHTHLRQHYLLALEAGDLEGLPSPVQARGMLSNYASFLGMDVERLMLRFADGLQAEHAAKYAGRRGTPRNAAGGAAAVKSPNLLSRIFSADILAVLVISIGMVAFVAWGAMRIFAMQSETEEDALTTPTAPSIADVLLASPTASQTFTPQPVTPTIPELAELDILPTQGVMAEGQEGVEAAVLPGGGNVQINVVVHHRAFMRATVDGEVEFEGRVQPGAAYNFAGLDSIELLTGNGAALQVFFDQTDLGRMGAYGQVVNRVYSADGIITATPTITLTPTETLEPTETLAVTETPTLTPSGTATPTGTPTLEPAIEEGASPTIPTNP